MGLFSGVKKAVGGVGKVFGGVFNGIDKLTGGRLGKLLGNKWVKGALLAVSVVTGGIAIANGVMAAGQAGIGAAAKQFATNMSMESGKSLMGSLVDGGKQFISGVAKGMVDPLGSEAGQAAQGMLDSVVGNITGTPVTSADELLSGSTGKAAAQNASAGADVAGVDVMDAGGVPQVDARGLENLSSSTEIPGVNAEQLMTPRPTGSPADWAGGSGDLMNPTAPMQFGGTPTPDMSMADQILKAGGGGGDALAGQLANGEKSGWLQSMAKYAKSPGGIQQIGGALQGWASGQALQERWDQMDKAEKKRYRSWTNDSFKMPRYGS